MRSDKIMPWHFWVFTFIAGVAGALYVWTFISEFLVKRENGENRKR
jgi:hypothetical protein